MASPATVVELVDAGTATESALASMMRRPPVAWRGDDTKMGKSINKKYLFEKTIRMRTGRLISEKGSPRTKLKEEKKPIGAAATAGVQWMTSNSVDPASPGTLKTPVASYPS